MSTAKSLLYTALGVTVVLLLTSDRAKKMRDDLEEKAKENVKKWKDSWSKAGHNSVGKKTVEV